jgi:SAM-dependent methyltransferase
VDPRTLYTKHADAYVWFNALFRAAQGYRSFFRSYEGLRSDLRILDAGCGTGIPTTALVRAMADRGLTHRRIDAFDLTPAMLARFCESVSNWSIPNVRVQEADVLDLSGLPGDWADYDLILSAAMLEYVPRTKLADALASLRARLAVGGNLLVFVTRRNWITAALIERPWSANRYTQTELRHAFEAAGLQRPAFRNFPPSFFWHNWWAHIVEASSVAHAYSLSES